MKVVHFDLCAHFSRLDRNVPFHLTKLLSPFLIFVSRLQLQLPNARWLGSGLCDRYVTLHWARAISELSNWNFCFGRAPINSHSFPHLRSFLANIIVVVTLPKSRGLCVSGQVAQATRLSRTSGPCTLTSLLLFLTSLSIL